MNKIYLILITFTMITISACSTYRQKVDRQGNKKYYNVSYGDLKEHKMDVFVPKTPKDSSFVILVHGGGWTIGSKSHLRSIQKFLLKNNVASANIDYRLVDGKNITYKEQIEDLNQATHFILDSLNNNPQLILLGESSGGHISMLYGYNNPDIVDKIITFAGPADLYSERYQKTKLYKSYTQATFKKIVGEKNKPFESAIEKLKEASPITQVSNVPTLTFQGTWDILVNKEQSLALDSVLTEKNIPHELVLIKNANHTPRFMPWWRNKVIKPKILEFIDKKPEDIGK